MILDWTQSYVRCSQTLICEQRGKDRDTSASGYYGTEEAARINEQTNGKLMLANNSHYEIAADGGQPFTFAKWTITLIVIRYAFIADCNNLLWPAKF